MIRELDTVVLAHDIDAYNLKKGDIGAIVHCYENGKMFEVEFVTAEGKTIALLELTEGDFRPVGGKEVLHVREFSYAAA